MVGKKDERKDDQKVEWTDQQKARKLDMTMEKKWVGKKVSKMVVSRDLMMASKKVEKTDNLMEDC